MELGIQDTIVPDRTLAKELAHVVRGEQSPNLTALVKDGVRFFSFVVSKQDQGPLSKLDIGEQSRVVALNRGEETKVATDETELREKDELIVLAHEDERERLERRFGKR